MPTLWPDDVEGPTSRDGMAARLGGRQLYFASRSLLMERPSLFEDHRAVITRHIMDNAGPEPVDLLTTNIEAVVARRPFTVSTKVEKLLLELARLTHFQVASIELTDRSPNSVAFDLCRAAGLSGVGELMNLLKYANDRGLAVLQRMQDGATVTTTIDGLIRVEERTTEADARNGFVAMWFNEELNEAFTAGMSPAIEDNGFNAIRIDRHEHNNKIDDEIISEIRRSRFVIADFSCGADGPRGGVYFEAGYALALGKPVVFTVRAPDLEKVHFDTRQFNHIVWEDPDDLHQKLKNRIAATIGRFGES